MFARQSKWGGCIDGERHIEQINEEFYHRFCTGIVRQAVRQTPLRQHPSIICLQYCIFSHLQNRCPSFISEGLH